MNPTIQLPEDTCRLMCLTAEDIAYYSQLAREHAYSLITNDPAIVAVALVFVLFLIAIGMEILANAYRR